MEKMTLKTPIGPLMVAAGESGIKEITFSKGDIESLMPAQPLLRRLKQQIEEYFSGQRRSFNLSLNPEGTAFQKSVWHELSRIPYGTTRTYAEIAQRLGKPKAVRAVGKANARNPLPLVIPCHRVVGVNNNLIGYSGGIERKQWLLRHEGALLL